MAGAWGRALTYSVTIKRSSTNTSSSGVTKFVYDQIIATGLLCSIQDYGGRLKQDDLGQFGLRKKSIIADVDFAVVEQNDLLVDGETGISYRVTHIHFVNDPNAPHYEAIGEQWVPGGGN